MVQRRDGPRRLRNHDDDDDDDDDVYGSVGVRCPRFLWGQVSCIRGRHRATVFVVAEPSLSCPTRPGPDRHRPVEPPRPAVACLVTVYIASHESGARGHSCECKTYICPRTSTPRA